MSELWSAVCDDCGCTKDGCVCAKRQRERETEAFTLLRLCHDVIDDVLDGKPSQHSLSDLNARLQAFTVLTPAARIETTPPAPASPLPTAIPVKARIDTERLVFLIQEAGRCSARTARALVRGRCTEKKIKDEEEAYRQLFEYVTGGPPTYRELTTMLPRCP